MKKRVCIFIDGNNFYFALKRNQCPTRVDYHALSQTLAGEDRELVRTYYYNAAYDALAYPEKYKLQQPFLDSLTHTPYLEMKLGKLVAGKDGNFIERGVAVQLAGDMVYYAAQNHYDTAILISENTDFAQVIKLVTEMGKDVEIALFPDNKPMELIEAADRTLELEDVILKNTNQLFPSVEDDNDNRGNLKKR
jgi:uncharacterized LabA/DUF88 family protein